MVLKTAFNRMTYLHSRPATLKRPGTPDIFSPVRISPSNFFRFLAGPQQVTIRGREFVLPVDTMIGHATQLVSFNGVPVMGEFHLDYDGDSTAAIAFDDDNLDVQTALRAITGLSAITVTGNFTDGFLVTFIGVDSPVLLVGVQEPSPLDADIEIDFSDSVLWSPIIKRGDRIIDEVYGHMTIDEIIEMPDIGGAIMGYRCRCE